MKIKAAILIVIVQTLPWSSASAGGSQGGSGPPAKEALEQMLMAADNGSAGLFRNELGDVSLGLNRSIGDQIVLMRGRQSDKSFLVSDADFDALSTSKIRNINALTVGRPDAVSRSYVVEDGDSLGELRLKDRREVARESVK